MSGTREANPKSRTLLLAGVAIALAVHAAGLLLFQLGEEEQPAAEVDYSFVSIPSIEEVQGDLIRERAFLFDSSPLFFPTRWNASFSPEVKAVQERPADLFESFPARLSFGESDFGLGAIVTVRSDTPLQSLRAFGDQGHTVFGRAEVEQPPMSPRFAVMEIVDPGVAETVLTVTVPVDGSPTAGGQLWAPVEFLIQVGEAGVVGNPVLLRGSGVEDVDQFLRDFVSRLTLGRMFEVGYYRVLAGP